DGPRLEADADPHRYGAGRVAELRAQRPHDPVRDGPGRARRARRGVLRRPRAPAAHGAGRGGTRTGVGAVPAELVRRRVAEKELEMKNAMVLVLMAMLWACSSEPTVDDGGKPGVEDRSVQPAKPIGPDTAGTKPSQIPEKPIGPGAGTRDPLKDP